MTMVKQLLRRTGLKLVERTSGKHKSQVKLSKQDDSTLRKYLYLVMLSLVGRHPDFKRWHLANQKKEISKQASLFKLIGKLCRMLVGMTRHGQTYRSPVQSVPAA